ncbi:MAG TPA: hypothetical protein DCS09_02685 [Porphyromonadaceae bacterium]|nr:MAG: hypothetical protein A2071_08205 [Bacteroidetes bacterium GWC1_47_7]HAR37561.1 hypothetical protein [Porphyromonadaceae bacterium]
MIAYVFQATLPGTCKTAVTGFLFKKLHAMKIQNFVFYACSHEKEMILLRGLTRSLDETEKEDKVVLTMVLK